MSRVSRLDFSPCLRLRSSVSGCLSTDSQDMLKHKVPGCSETEDTDTVTDVQTDEIQGDFDGGNITCSTSVVDVDQQLDNVAREKLNERVGAFPLSNLPPDMLLHVFSFLGKNEQLHMSSVCKPWRQLIFSSACLWRKRQMVLRCSHHSRHSRHAFFYARRLGRYLHKLSVACEHPSNHACRSIAVCFRNLMTGLKAPQSLRSFKVTELKLGHTKASVLLAISTSLERFIYSLQHLGCFQMSNAHWPAQEGLKVINTVLTSCQHSLHTLRIDGFFLPRFVPSRATDVLCSGLGQMTCLSKLSIDYFYLDDQSVMTLAAARRAQLRSLKLVACDVSPQSTFVSKTAWFALTRACPSMRVEMVVQGFTVSPAHSLPLLLCPALRLHRLCLSIGSQYTFLDMARLNMAAVLSHVTRHFRRRLSRFEMDIDNHSDPLDSALIRLVRKCRNLASVKVKAYFNSTETDVTLREILRVRRDKQACSGSGRDHVSDTSTGSDDTRAEVVTQEDGGGFSGPSSDRTYSISPVGQHGVQQSDGYIPGEAAADPDIDSASGTSGDGSEAAGSLGTMGLRGANGALMTASSARHGSGLATANPTLATRPLQEESLNRPSTSGTATALRI